MIPLLIPLVTSPAFLSVLGAVITFIVGKFGWNKIQLALLEKAVTEGIPYAYWGVNEIARRTDNKIDDKVAEGLRILKEFLAAKGHDPEKVTPEQLKRAELVFNALHAQESTNTRPVEVK